MMTGDEYRASLRDGRLTFFEGKPVHDLPEHPILGQTVDSAAAGYDRFYDPTPDAVPAFMMIPSSKEELRQQVELHETVDLLTHVTFASIMTLLTAADRIESELPENAERIRAYVRDVQAKDLRITQCITDAKGDRSKPPAAQDDPDAYVRVVERSPDGVVIRGAKLHISAASMGHELMTIPTKSMKLGEEDYSIACMVPVNAKGVKIINTTYAPRHADKRDFPVSGRHHTPEGFVIFDDVFVPNERVFLAGSHPHLAAVFAHSLGLWERLGGLSSMAGSYDVLVGLAQLIAEANGLERVGHIKEKISEMMINATLVRATLEAAIENCAITSDGAAFPNELYTNVGKYHGAATYSLMVRHLHDIAGGSILTAPGRADLDNPETGPLVRKYMATGRAEGEYRTRLFHAIRDLTADALGGWSAVTNIQAGGGLYAQRIVSRMHYDLEGAKRMALERAGLGELVEGER